MSSVRMTAMPSRGYASAEVMARALVYRSVEGSALKLVAASARTRAHPWGCQEAPSARAWAPASAVGSVDPKERVSAPPWASRTVLMLGPEMVLRWAA